MLDSIFFRPPTIEDGMPVFHLIQQCPPLDTNSIYCNLLQCSHFSGTSVAAESSGHIVGFISGYIIPDRTDTLFIWQIAVSEKVRGQGLAAGMLNHILARPQCQSVRYIETSITEDNLASWSLFKSFAKKRSIKLQPNEWFDQDTHFNGQHDSEMLVRLGPLSHKVNAT